MNSIIGYILSIVGLAILVGSTKIFELVSKYLASLKFVYIILAGISFILVGVLTLMSSSSTKVKKPAHAFEEVPIYEGEGKNRKIVGYRKN